MPLDPALAERLYGLADANRWNVSVERLSAALETSLARAFPDGEPRTDRVKRYLESLHLTDLALACACADGHEAAWDHFVREHRPLLYRAADAIDPTGGARDLADSLYGELFGVTEKQGQRLSLFRYFHGRSSLGTWLRAVLAQRHVDRIRQTRAFDPLPPGDTVAARGNPPNPSRVRFVEAMRRAVGAAVGRLTARDRLRLSLYYLQDLTLAQIGLALREHEATSSRRLARTRRDLRRDIEQQLRHRERMSDAEVAECFSSVAEDAGTLDLGDLLSDTPARKKVGQDRSYG